VGDAAVGPNLTVGPPAPDFKGIDHWLNSSPLTIASLRGKVVLVDFWTYSCINCIRSLPYVEGWYKKYAAEGLVVVGVHSPEFEFEHDTSNVQAAISRFGLTYPVAQDNEFATWQAYGNSYWPADYLIDAQGRLRSVHFGEGDYDSTESQIRTLLAEAGAAALPTAAPSAVAPPITANQTPETYLGTDRAASFVAPEPADGLHQYSFPISLPNDAFALSGTFDFEPQYIANTAAGDQLELSFQARDRDGDRRGDRRSDRRRRRRRLDDDRRGSPLPPRPPAGVCPWHCDHHLQRALHAGLRLHFRQLTGAQGSVAGYKWSIAVSPPSKQHGAAGHIGTLSRGESCEPFGP
jgi:thiol-disulfide isomerase/thioredoxin